ncbi:MAG: HPr kinase/phosphatase C-terminal domain-containing protein [Pseudomonadota bacterium]
MSEPETLLYQASVVAIEGRALALEGPPGSGKSSLALALIGRGAALIGDDGVALHRDGDRVIAAPPPNTNGLLEIRGVGLVTMPVAPPTPLALVLKLGMAGERLPDSLGTRALLGCNIPVLPFEPGNIAPAQRAHHALRLHGIAP